MVGTCIVSWSSPTVPLITKPGEKLYVTLDEASWISSISALGASIGPFVTGSIVDFFGRKPTLLAILLGFTATWIVIYNSVNVPIILCARFVGGLGVGCVYATLPMFSAEISPVSTCYRLMLILVHLFTTLWVLHSYTAIEAGRQDGKYS